MNERLLILDSNSLLNRAFYALPPLTNSEGLHTNAVYGFTNMLFKMKEEIKPDYIVATFDRKAPTFRHDEYKEYKAGRKKMPPELAEQFPVVKELLRLMDIDIFEIDGYEADDLIGTLSLYAEKQGIEVYIATGDRDALQLASDNIKVVITKKGMTEKEIYDKKRMVEELNVTPTQFIDVKGLMGDASDNIPGVPGIGEKTAFKLISEYGSIENVLQNIGNISGKKVVENLREYSEQALFSKRLATIFTDVPIEIDLNSIKSTENYDVKALRQLFFSLQFKSLLEKLSQEAENKVVESVEKINYKVIDSANEASELVGQLLGRIYVSYSMREAHTYSKRIPEEIFLSSAGGNYCIKYMEIEEQDIEGAKTVLRVLFNNEDIELYGYDFKLLYTYLNKLGILYRPAVFDAKIAAYLIDSSKGDYPLETLIQEYLRVDISGDEEETKIRETALIKELSAVLMENLKKLDMEKLFYELEMPLVEVLASMESLGFKVEKKELEKLGDNFKSEIEKVQREIYEMAGEEFNIGSPKQLGKILFEKLDLPALKKTKTGYSTNAEVLEELSDKHPIIDKITYYRQLTKLQSTYIVGLSNVIDVDGRIHSSFNQAVTTTGRLSSTEPNLQNIPIKYEMGRAIRRVFIPDNEDSVILSADYSQIELRVLAEIAGDENMIEAFVNKVDIHTKTASEVFKVPLGEVSSIMRSRAKAVNFGIVYGISDFSLAKDLKIPKNEAKQYIETYFERYPKVKEYLDTVVKKAKADQYVTTLLNRRRYIPEIKGPNKIIMALGERLAMNAPIQGTAADIIKLAMVNVHQELRKGKMKSSLILQVHDELILNVYKEELDEVKALVKDEMEKVLKLSLPLVVDINVGDNWYEAK